MNIKNISVLFLVIFSLLGLMVWLGSNQSENADASKIESELSAENTFYDFGKISMAKGDVSYNFKVVNNTDRDILVPSLTTSCMCTRASFLRPDGSKNGPFGMSGMGFVPKANETIKAGETKVIEVVYDPAAHGPAGVGPIDRLVYLQDDSGGTLQFRIKALVTP